MTYMYPILQCLMMWELGSILPKGFLEGGHMDAV